ncbi:MAG TPA: ATP-binding protein [Phycisphaerae bacterium]|nr:ATP-binding protein [Phycisphaerae bacterium]
MDTLRVLVVDDELGMQHSVARALQHFTIHLPDVEGEVQFEVDRASSGEEGLTKVAAQPPDILLLDYKLGDMTGLEVLERLVQQEHDVLTVMITAFATLETAIRATKCGAFDFLAKPFTPQELKETIRKASLHLVVQRQARKLAAEKRKVRFEFISVLGHELKAPLSAIEGYLRILKDRAAGSDLAAYDNVIDRSLVRAMGMRKLILDLLDMTRIESGQKKREPVDVDVREIAKTAMETVRPDALARNITLQLHGDAPVPMVADRNEIEIIFNNLLSNAVKYNRDGGRVDVRIGQDGQKVTITVADTGIGMTPEEAGRLFKDFVRIKSEKTVSIPGSGLGLSLVKKLAIMYGGDATVSSKPDVGSTFTVVMQRSNKPPTTEHEPKRDSTVAP